MSTSRVRGQRESAPESLRSVLVPSARVVDAVRTDAAARAGAPEVELGAGDDDLIEVELENGVRFVTTVRRLREDADRGRARGVPSGEPGLLPTHYPQASAQRGLLGIAIRRIVSLFVKPEVTAEWAANRIESKLEGRGMHRITRGGDLVRGAIEPGDEPVLLFVHGTASSTRGAYGALWSNEEGREYGDELARHYGEGRIFGFEHCTLTAGPLENAIDLLCALPDRCPPLHVVSHSRGGLVGDLIGHGGLAEAFPPDLLRDCEVRPEDRGRYRELNRLLAEKAPRLERFVRVACPAGGTTLASGRLDIHLSILAQLLGRIPFAGPFLEPLGDLLAAVAKERANPDVLPGLEAQMPSSSLVRVLAGSRHVLDSDLTVIAGDSDGLLKNLANLFYWGANDLVVDTGSMYAGARRSRRRWWIAEGSEVHHCNYFARGESTERLVAGLTRSDDASGGFSLAEPRAAARTGARGEARGLDAIFGEDVDLGRADVLAHRDRPAVFVLPGIMGSHIARMRGATGERVWIDVPALVRGGMRRLRIDAEDVRAEALVGLAYGDFVAFLRERGHHVLPFPYDWRRSVTEAAAALAEEVAARLDASSRPVCIVAHSMGGLVARALLRQSPELWESIVRRGGRLVQAGTPNRGSFVIPRLLAGEDELLRRLAGLDLRLDVDGWTRIIADFPGLLEMAPHPDDAGGPDFFAEEAADATWRAFSVRTAPDPARRAAALETIRGGLADLDPAMPIDYVAGVADRTPTFEGPLADPAEIAWTARGDGRVTWASGIPSGVRTWYVHAAHGDLLNHRAAFHGLLDLVEGRAAPRLSKDEPVRREVPVAVAAAHGALVSEEFRTPPLPDDETLTRAALGMSPRRAGGRARRDDEETPCAVRVVHGDLAYVRDPVIVGHYVGDPLVSAEAALDRALDGALSFRHQIGLYAGELGTAEAVLRRMDDDRAGRDADAADRERPGPSGAIVVGLGRVGDLSPGGLTGSVVAGLLRLVQARRDLGRAVSDLAVTSLLIGTGEAGIGLSQSLEAILTAVRIANRELARAHRLQGARTDDDARPPSITTLAFLELQEDRALQALHALRAMRDLFEGAFHMSGVLERTSGQQRRVTFERPDGWWTRLVIRRDDERHERIHFLVPGDAAGARSEFIELQRAMFDEALAAAMASPRPTAPGVSHTLFEMLTPHRLKGSASRRRNLALVLDEHTAGFPWELLVDRRTDDGRPLGIGAGLLRQLQLVDQAIARPTSALNRLVVIGDPPTEGRLPELPGAQAEARAVADLFERRDWDVVRRIRKDAWTRAALEDGDLRPLELLEALLTKDPRILHLAGHGVHEPGNPAASGMVLGGSSEGGPLVLLNPALVEQIRLVPELVFLNCCHLGRVEPRPHRLAADIAVQFIRCGARAVIAAGWAVDDGAALTFAKAFYDAMLDGAPFGEAVRDARHRTWSEHRHVNTWAAYQCYGDAGFRLTMDLRTRARVASGRPGEFVDPAEMVVALENATHRVRVALDAATIEALVARVRDLEAEAERRGWSGHGAVAIAIARAYGELGEYEAGIRWYDRAEACECGSLSLRDLEQRANLRARFAAGRWRAFCATSDADETADGGRRKGVLERCVEDVERAIAELEGLVRLFGATRERHALVASALKRRSMIVDPRASGAKADLDDALLRMTEEYMKGAALEVSSGRAYPGLNTLLGVLLLGGPWRSKNARSERVAAAQRSEFDALLEDIREEIRATSPRDFWEEIYRPELALVEALASESLGERLPEIRRMYRDALRGRGSIRERHSVADQLHFLRSILELRGDSAIGARRASGARVTARSLLPLVDDLLDCVEPSG